MNQSEFKNRVRSLFNIDGHLLPELTAEQRIEFVRDPVRFFIRCDDRLADAVWKQVEARNTPRTPGAADVPSIEALKQRIDHRLNDHLVEMLPDYDDSIVGFNEAWNIVRAAFAEARAPDAPPAGAAP